MTKLPPKARFFRTAAAFHAWLERNYASESELVVGLYKKDSDRPSITYPEALDAALAYGWIDGIRRGVDAESYTIRFTPRKARSHWSRINIARAAELKAASLMHSAGLDAYERRDESKTINYSYEMHAATLGREYEKRFKANKNAWAYFTSQAPFYQRHAKFWVMNAKKEETREKRLDLLIADSAAGRRLAASQPGRKARKGLNP
jgi:uncharacterized protein YdeI (YjbR/CyaY-like superfamily)